MLGKPGNNERLDTDSCGPDSADLAALMAAAAESLHRQAELEDVLRALVLAARDTIPGVQHAGISIAHRNGQIDTVAATSPLVHQVDELQYRLHEGPCIDALAGRWPATANQLSHDTRWPRYAPAAARLGIESQMGLQLADRSDSTGDSGLAGLNLYSADPNTFTDDTTQIAGLFAVHAGHALVNRPGSDGGSGYWISTKVWSLLFVA